MNCGACGEPLRTGQRFCGGCGTPVADRSGNAVSTGGGDVYGSLYQAGRDVVVHPQPTTSPSATYEAVPKWRSPFTQALLSWAGLIIGALTLFPLWKVLEPALKLVSSGPGTVPDTNSQSLWLAIFMALSLAFVLALGLRRVAKAQLRKPLVLGWAVSGSGGRISIEKVSAGPCPECGGKMRYLNKATGWIDRTDANGKTRREVTERVPALECARNPKHWAEVDPAEYVEP